MKLTVFRLLLHVRRSSATGVVKSANESLPPGPEVCGPAAPLASALSVIGTAPAQGMKRVG